MHLIGYSFGMSVTYCNEKVISDFYPWNDSTLHEVLVVTKMFALWPYSQMGRTLFPPIESLEQSMLSAVNLLPLTPSKFQSWTAFQLGGGGLLEFCQRQCWASCDWDNWQPKKNILFKQIWCCFAIYYNVIKFSCSPHPTPGKDDTSQDLWDLLRPRPGLFWQRLSIWPIFWWAYWG